MLIWYFKSYSLDCVSAVLRRNGYSEEEAARRAAAYASWLQRQETACSERPSSALTLTHV